MNRTLVEYREARAVELSLEGLNYDQIAHELGYANRSGAWKAARRCLARRRDLAAGAYIEFTLADLEAVQEKAWPAAMNGNLAAAELALRAMEDRWRLVEFLSTQETRGGKREVGETEPRRPVAAPSPADRDLGPFRDFGV